MDDLVTVGIPTRKTRPAIYTAIQSILDQNYKNFEILIVDDSGEPDNERITELERNFKKLPNFRIVHNKKNLGIGGARNAIIDNAKGKYLCFLSADDEFFPDYIEMMVSVSKKHPDSILYCNYSVMNSEGIITSEVRVPAFYDYDDFKKMVIAAANRNGMFVCYNLFAPTKIFRKYKFDSQYRFGEDYEHLLRCVLVENVNFVHIPKSLFKYCSKEDSTTGEKWKKIPENDAKIRTQINKLAGRSIF